MSEMHHKGCTLRITNIPRDMQLRALKGDMESYGTITRWVTPPGPVHVYAVYENEDMACAALIGLREHRRIVVDYACLYE